MFEETAFFEGSGMKKTMILFLVVVLAVGFCSYGVHAQQGGDDFYTKGADIGNLLVSFEKNLRRIKEKQKQNAAWDREQQEIRELAKLFGRNKETFNRALADVEQSLISRGASDRILNRHRDFCETVKTRMDRIEEKLDMEDYEGLGNLLPRRKIPGAGKKTDQKQVEKRRRGVPEYFPGRNCGGILKPKQSEIKEKEIKIFPRKKDKFGLWQKDGLFKLVRFEPSVPCLLCDLGASVVNDIDPVVLSGAASFDLDLPAHVRPIQLAGLDSISGLLSQSTLNAIRPPVSADLLEDGVDIVFTEEIKALAESLDKDPIQIYEHVKNSFTYQPYFGSLKGARGALFEKSGNDVDLSSLLISLLRYSGFPARYGEALVTVDVERVMNWLGFDDPGQVGFYLSSAGIKDVENLYSGSQIRQVRFRHVYVEVYLPYGNYRGQIRDDSHKLWVPLSPAFKKYEHTPGHKVPFDTDVFLAGLEDYSQVDENNTLTGFDPAYIRSEIEVYGDEIADYLDALDPDMTINEFYGQSIIDEKHCPILPITLPFVSEGNKSCSRLGDIDQHHRVKIQLSYHDMDLNADEEEGGLATQEIRWEKPVAEIYGKRLTLSYRPATEEDEALLFEYDGNILGTPCYLIHMFPQLMLEGEIVAENVDNSTGPINNAEISMGLEETLRVEILKPGETHFPERRSDYQITVGDHAAIVLGTGHMTGDVLNASLKRLENASNDENSALDDLLGQQLKLTGETWFFQADLFNDLIAKQAGVKWFRDPSDLCVFRHLDVAFVAGYFPTSIKRSTIFIDAPGNRLQALPKDSDWQKRVGFFRTAGMFGSILEHAVLTQLYQKDAVSAAKLLSLAIDNGTAVYEINPDNRDMLVPMLNLPEGDISIINRELDLGQTVIVPEKRISRNDYSGVGIISLTPDDDPMGPFRQGYFISRGRDGGQITTAIQSLLSDFVQPELMNWISFGKNVKNGVSEIITNSNHIMNGNLPVKDLLKNVGGMAVSVFMAQAQATVMGMGLSAGSCIISLIDSITDFYKNSRIVVIDFYGSNVYFPDQDNGSKKVNYMVFNLIGLGVEGLTPSVTCVDTGFKLESVLSTNTKGEGAFSFSINNGKNLPKGYEIETMLTVDKPDGETAGTSGTFIVLKIDVVPDYNRDGNIDDADRGMISGQNPWVFWVNDDNDDDADPETGLVDEGTLDAFPDDMPGQYLKSDRDDDKVNGIRDLVDFFPLYFDLEQALELFKVSEYEYRLSHQDSALSILKRKQFCFNETDRDKKASAYLKRPGIAFDMRENKTVQIKQNLIEPYTFTNEELFGIGEENKNIFLFEAIKESNKSLVLEIVRKSDDEVVLSYGIPLKLLNVENMYYHRNLRNVGCFEDNKCGDYPDRLFVSDKPFCMNEANNALVWIHGYNVDEKAARATYAEVFKRLFHSGFNGQFYGVSWYGNPPGELVGVNDSHYHQAVVNAFNVAHEFRNFIQVLKGEGKTVSVAAHSLGNLVTGAAIEDYSAEIDNCFAVDASVALEAYGDNSTSAADNGSMIKVGTWKRYWDYNDKQKKLLASEWHTLFNDEDSRSRLTWRNRLGKVIGRTNMYNFYSSTEDVLAAYEGDDFYEGGKYYYAWAKQEKFKGREGKAIKAAGGTSPFAGWGHNMDENEYIKTITVPYNGYNTVVTVMKEPSELGELSPEFIKGLKTKPFFLAQPEELFDPDTGSDFVMEKVKNTGLYDYYDKNDAGDVLVRDWLLAEAFPATTLAMGVRKSVLLKDNNFDMGVNDILKNIFITDLNVWPREGSKWFHSDYMKMSYHHVYRFYESITGKTK